MKYGRKIFVSAFWVLLGAGLMIASLMGTNNEYWSGMGCAFIVVGMLQLVRQIKYHTNEEYREKVDTEIKDERNAFIRGKAWGWAGYLFVLIAAVASIILRIMGQDALSEMAGFSVCLLILLYWGSYMYLRKKY